MSTNLSPGWYPDQENAEALRYWDGQQWTGRASVQTGEPPILPTSRGWFGRHRTPLILSGSFLAIVVLAIAVIGFEMTQSPTRDLSIGTTSSPSPAVKVNPVPVPVPAPAKATLGLGDAFYVELGYSVAESGRLYYLASDPSKFTCGQYGCMYYTIVALGGCPSSLYVEASIMSNNVVVGMTNDSVGAVASGEDARVLLRDFTGSGDSFRVTKVNCY